MENMLCMLGNFLCFCCCLLTFFKSNVFKKNTYRNTIRMSKCLDSYRDRLGPNCLQRLSVDDKECG